MTAVFDPAPCGLRTRRIGNAADTARGFMPYAYRASHAGATGVPVPVRSTPVRLYMGAVSPALRGLRPAPTAEGPSVDGFLAACEESADPRRHGRPMAVSTMEPPRLQAESPPAVSRGLRYERRAGRTGTERTQRDSGKAQYSSTGLHSPGRSPGSVHGRRVRARYGPRVPCSSGRGRRDRNAAHQVQRTVRGALMQGRPADAGILTRTVTCRRRRGDWC